MPRGIANRRLQTFEDLSPELVNVFQRLGDPGLQETFLSSLPKITVPSEGSPKNPAERIAALARRIESVDGLIASFTEYRSKLEGFKTKEEGGEGVDRTQVRTLPVVANFKIAYSYGKEYAKKGEGKAAKAKAAKELAATNGNNPPETVEAPPPAETGKSKAKEKVTA